MRVVPKKDFSTFYAAFATNYGGACRRFTVDGRTLDLFDVVLSAVLLDIDMVFLCREDCKGLCPVCGADLNEGMCDCGKNDQEDR